MTGYYPRPSGSSQLCTRCSVGCVKCNATDYCTQCDDERYLVTSGGSAGKCSQCPFPCAQCNDTTITASPNDKYCLECLAGYFYLNDSSGACGACSPGCLSCNSTDFCLSCASTYYLYDNLLTTTDANTCQLCVELYDYCVECVQTECLKCE